jgi:membrane protein implicated in regulation of membrane protease activity
MKRLWVALSVYAVLAILAWTTLTDQKFRLACVAILAMFALRTLSWHRKLERERQQEDEQQRDGNHPG